MIKRTASLLALSLLIHCSLCNEPILEIDFTRTKGTFRMLHGVNKGPLVGGGLIDLTSGFNELGIPQVRLHDCHWPNPDVVDIHAIFPNWDADPQMPESYDFRLTDDYLAALHKLGAGIVYRLGESIEHTSLKRFVHPPKNVEKWAAVCEGIIRHYNEGWGNGQRYGIKYWEIWNEPENRPAMWSGTDEDYFRLYSSTARRLKARWPDIKIGGPAVGASGGLQGEEFVPSKFVVNFLERCHGEKLPLDFFSWHCYSDSPEEFLHRAKGIRKLLDGYGFAATESHLNEWNYLPGNDWKAVTPAATPAQRKTFYDEMSGATGAAFILRSLLLFQDAPIDCANFFHGETGPFGLFSEHGGPYPAYFAFKEFNELRSASRILITNFPQAGITAAAAKSGELTTLLLGCSRKEQGVVIKSAQPLRPGEISISRRRLLKDGGWSSEEKISPAESERFYFEEPGIGLLTFRFSAK